MLKLSALKTVIISGALLFTSCATIVNDQISLFPSLVFLQKRKSGLIINTLDKLRQSFKCRVAVTILFD